MKTKVIGSKVSQELYGKIHQIAAEQNLTVSMFVKNLLIDVAEEENNEFKKGGNVIKKQDTEKINKETPKAKEIIRDTQMPLFEIPSAPDPNEIVGIDLSIDFETGGTIETPITREEAERNY